MMAEHYTRRARDLKAQLQGVLAVSADGWGDSLFREKPTKSALRWAAYLKQHGPTTRKAMADANGPLTGTLPPHIESLGRPLSQIPDDFYPAEMMFRCTKDVDGAGRPPDLYFLWSQRYDVFPDLVLDENIENEPVLTKVAIIEIDDPINMEPDPTPPVPKQSAVLDLPLVPARYSTLQEWYDENYQSHFIYAEHGEKFDPEEMAHLKATCPEGVDPLAAIALAATGRLSELIEAIEHPAVEPLLGVIRPEELPDAPHSAAQAAMASEDWD